MANKKSENVLVIETKEVDIKTLKPYYKNPRVGNVTKIAASLERFGQFRPILVNVGSKTKRPHEIAAGNHTYLGARKLGWPKILVSFIDVDADTLKQIVLTDNRLAEEGSYDTDILAELMKDMKPEDYEVTGFSSEEVDDLIQNAMSGMTDMVNDVGTMQEEVYNEQEQERLSNTFMGSELGDEGDDDDEYDDPSYKAPKDGIEDQSGDMGGVIQFKAPEDITFPGVGFFGIPKLRSDMLMTFDEIDPNLKAWAGSATKDDDLPERWWLYNWGTDSTSGMQQDKSQVIVSFYSFDDYFDNWWYYPERYIGKVVNSKIKYMVTPNWSMATELPRVESLWNLYRSRWVGRFAQECGLKIIPDIEWRDGDMEFLVDHVLATLPKKLPLIALQMQTLDPKQVTGGMGHFRAQISKMFEILQPEGVILYAGKPGKELVESLLPEGTKMFYVETRMAALAEKAKTREKKTTI